MFRTIYHEISWY